MEASAYQSADAVSKNLRSFTVKILFSLLLLLLTTLTFVQLAGIESKIQLETLHFDGMISLTCETNTSSDGMIIIWFN